MRFTALERFENKLGRAFAPFWPTEVARTGDCSPKHEGTALAAVFKRRARRALAKMDRECEGKRSEPHGDRDKSAP
jgi:hypothetical protein